MRISSKDVNKAHISGKADLLSSTTNRLLIINPFQSFHNDIMETTMLHSESLAIPYSSLIKLP